MESTGQNLGESQFILLIVRMLSGETPKSGVGAQASSHRAKFRPNAWAANNDPFQRQSRMPFALESCVKNGLFLDIASLFCLVILSLTFSLPASCGKPVARFRDSGMARAAIKNRSQSLSLSRLVPSRQGSRGDLSWFLAQNSDESDQD